MTVIAIPWVPRVIMTGRRFRLPVRANEDDIVLDAPGFSVMDHRWSKPDGAFFYYLQAPDIGGDYEVVASQGSGRARARIEVKTLADLRGQHTYNGLQWPRRWPVGTDWGSTKKGQTLQDLPRGKPGSVGRLQWWLEQEDEVIWRQLPPADFPRAHYVNVSQGCPNCGPAIFAHHGFYPWKRQYHPPDMRSECPACRSRFPSNDLASGDYSSGEFVDDGYGYFDDAGNVFLFVASYFRDMVGLYDTPIVELTRHLRTGPFDEDLARRLGLLLLRYAVEELYLSAVPQFRHGPSQEVETAWDWGQSDWASQTDPLGALYRKGSLRYSIDVPVVAEIVALAYDTIWPLMRQDDELVVRARALGLDIEAPDDGLSLVEEMLASLLQCCMDGGGVSNLPRVSESVLTVLRCLGRHDAQDVVGWLYDRGPARLRVFVTNNFFADGTPPEAPGGYNDTHTRGLFSLEYHLRQLRAMAPGAYAEDAFPSLLADPRAFRVLRAPYEIALLGKVPLHFGDGGSSGVQRPLAEAPLLSPLSATTRAQAEQFLGSTAVQDLDQVSVGEPLCLGTTVHDGVGFAILRTGEKPERAAVGIVYGDSIGHRHMDLLDLQLYAYQRPFLSDLGYPQSWGSVTHWEGNWATHNTMWGVVPGLEPLGLPFDTPRPFMKQIAGRGRLVRLLQLPGLQVAEFEAERWAFSETDQDWYRPGVHFRRLVALVETAEDGVAVVDLARIRGGCEHWRVCRGLEGSFNSDVAELVPRPGNAADEGGHRGQLQGLEHPDYAGLACMDDVSRVLVGSQWTGTWRSRHEDGVFLDMHQLRAPSATKIEVARATQVMGRPEDSGYCYRTVLWRSRPVDNESTCIDLVFEPHLSEATLAEVRSLPVAEGDTSASGVELVESGGRKVRIFWAPEGGKTVFADGSQVDGVLAVVDGEHVSAAAATAWHRSGCIHRFDNAVQQGVIVEIDRQACTIEVAELSSIYPGDRLRVNPDGRSHNYRVEAVTPTEAGLCLGLDISSILGRSRVSSVEGCRVVLDFNIQTRTGRVHGTRLERECDGAWAEIAGAMNPDVHSTIVVLKTPLHGLAVGEWIRVVAYVVGDGVRC